MGRCAKGGISIFERGLTEKRGVGDLYHKMLYYVIRSRLAPTVRAPGPAFDRWKNPVTDQVMASLSAFRGYTPICSDIR